MEKAIDNKYLSDNMNDFYRRFKWENYRKYPSLFLTQLSYFSSSLKADKFTRMSLLSKEISHAIEIHFLENNDFVVNMFFVEILNDITSYKIKINHDITEQQFDRQLTKLKYLDISNKAPNNLKENAIKELTSILEKCGEKIQVKTEVETLAFILDRLMQKNSNIDIDQDYKPTISKIDAIMFESGGIKYAIPMHSIIKIDECDSCKCTVLPNKAVLFQSIMGTLPLTFISENDQLIFNKSQKGMTLLYETDQVHLIYISQIKPIKNLAVNVQNNRYRKTAITENGEILWLYGGR